MEPLMIFCPQTGQAIRTAYEAAPELFRKTPVFFARTFCPFCRVEHEWFARDAWVPDAKPPARTGSVDPI
jgi:hypothetical protein